MSVAPYAGVVALDNFKSPTASADGLQGQVPKPLAGQQTYILSASGWIAASGGTVTSVNATVPAFLSVSGVPITASGTIAITYSGTALPVANGGTGVTASTGASSVVLRDANQNVTANAFDDAYVNTAASGTQITLTVASARRYTITGSGGQVIKLPDATTLVNGTIFEFDNNQSSGAITVNNNSNTLVVSVPSGGIVRVDLLSNAIAAGSWDRHDLTPANVSWSTNTLDYAGSITNATWNGNVIAYNRGGTGQSSVFVAGGVVYGSTTTAMAVTAAGTSGQVLTSAGASAPAFSSNIDGVTIGGTTPAAGSFTTLIGGSGSANYEQITGGSAGNAVQFQTLGSDANISVAVQPKGTGAVDLAAGSKGVNISNGGTVTAITGTAGGSYTTVPTFTVSAPTTAGGTQATGTCAMAALTITLQTGGSNYAIGDTITLTGGTFSQAIVLTVVTLSGSAVATWSVTNSGTYTVLPTNPISQGSTSGSGTGATFNVTAWQVRTTAYTITNAGSGYVEQPTITFSSGSAAAYATVGSGAVIKWLGGTNNIQNASGNVLQFQDGGGATPAALVIKNGGSPQLFPSLNNTDLYLSSSGTGNLRFYTNSVAQTQMVVSHTASAVNYVQVTGAATGVFPVISAQGSDAAVGLNLYSKGASRINFFNNNGTNRHVSIAGNGTAAVNYIDLNGNIASNAPSIAVAGTDANIDLTLTPKGTGRVNITTSIKPKVNSAANVTSPLAWDSTSYDEYAITGLANALTINADANASPADGQRMMFRFKDNGTARALTWTTGSTNSFRVVGVTLPTTTVASKLVYIGCVYNAADSRWDAVAVSQEA
jgi:hypothetical protein